MTNKPYPKEPLKFLWSYLIKNKLIFFGALLFALLEQITDKLAPYYFSRIVGLFGDNATFDSVRHSLFLFLFLFALMQIINRVFYYISRLIIEVKIGPKIAKDVASDLFLYLHGHSIDFFANNMTGKLAEKVKGASDTASQLCVYTTYFSKFVFDFVAMSAMFAVVNVGFSVGYGSCLLVVSAIALLLSKSVNKKRADFSSYKTEVSGNFIDSMQNNFFVKIFNGKKHEEKRWDNILEQEQRLHKSFLKGLFTQDFSKGYIFGLINIIFLVYALFLWKETIIKVEDLVLIFLLMEQSSGVMNHMLHMIYQYNYNLSELKSHLEPFSKDYDIKDLENAKKLKVTKGEIEFKDVTFGYHKKTKVFNNFNLKIKAGENIGIVGSSGCGKSTLVSLLQRLYDVDSGSILIDGKNIKSVTQDSICQNISFISQQNQLFKRTIKENIAYGKQSAKLEDVIKASKNAYAHSFIKDLENGYDTIIGGDKKLSGGQMQRIAIARSLLENAPILILDEATSSLDSQSEDYIQKAITKLIKNKTVIAIAHRLSTLKNMDRIIVIEDGNIVEDGNIEELLKQKGKFAEFWNLQKLVEKNNE